MYFKDPPKPGSEHTLEAKVWYTASDGSLSGSLVIDTTDMSGHWVKCGTFQIKVTIPDDFDPRKQALALVDAKIQETRANFEATLTQLKSLRMSLLAIENAPTSDYGLPLADEVPVSEQKTDNF